jgi:hypothetical protein
MDHSGGDMSDQKASSDIYIEGIRIPAEYQPIGGKMLEALLLYQKYGEVSGGFMEALLANDLSHAVCNADPNNLANIRRLGLWLANMMPGEVWGSYKKVNAWQKAKAQDRARWEKLRRSRVYS